MVEFICNLCGTKNFIDDPLKRHRELLNCAKCGCCARFRGIIHAVERELLGLQGGILRSCSICNDIKGIGFSDAEQYAVELSRIFNYTNTFFHTDPVLDLMSTESVSQYNSVDFVICSDVLEHVPPPSIKALQNLRKLVRPGGILILTVPYLEGYETIEHYPHLYKWKTIELDNGCHAIVNLRRPASNRTEPYIECYPHPTFHGGPGEVLEMRIFGEGDLWSRLAYSGFSSIQEMVPNLPEIGYVWDYNVERPELGDRRLKSCVLICR